jgi:hypothetical protein
MLMIVARKPRPVLGWGLMKPLVNEAVLEMEHSLQHCLR